MNTYICNKRARFKGSDGDFNIPYGTEIECQNDILSLNGKRICFNTSQRAYDYFSCNDDGNGLLRGKLVDSIMRTLEKKDSLHQLRWNKVWGDSSIRKYKRTEREDYWLWNHEFYNAPIEDLRHIADLIGAKED